MNTAKQSYEWVDDILHKLKQQEKAISQQNKQINDLEKRLEKRQDELLRVVEWVYKQISGLADQSYRIVEERQGHILQSIVDRTVEYQALIELLQELGWLPENTRQAWLDKKAELLEG